MTSEPPPASHRPLTPAAKASLVLSASATIVLCYLFSTVALLLLLVLLGVEALLVIAGARFGFAWVMVNAMKRHVPLLGMFCRSFWLSRGTEYRIQLQPGDAPRLFRMVGDLCARLAIAVPHSVAIEMNCGAWVQLKGYRRGAGRTILGLGYDLMAGLSTSEVEAVLAHEMAHAKLVHRGLKSWLGKGVHRSALLTQQLAERVHMIEAAKQTSTLTSTLRRISHALTKLAARLVAAYSRQDEFEADRGAAELCGAAPLRSSLQRLEAMEERLERMPWRERVSQLELEGSYSGWLAEELRQSSIAAAAPEAVRARDPYSTHPALPDRLAALPPDDERPHDRAPGIGLLADPDRVARELMAEIQRLLAESEQKDTKSLGRWARKTQRTSNIRWQQTPGVLLVVVGVFVSIFTLAARGWVGHAVAVGIIVAGVYAWRLGRYRDRRTLPVPRFAQLKRAWEAPPETDLVEREKAIETELRALIAPVARRRQKVTKLLQVGEAALADCHYLRAHVAARVTLELDQKSVEAALILAVAAGALGNGDQAAQMLRFIVHRTAMASPSTRWGSAWALVLLSDWNAAEALLWQVHEKAPEEPTFLLLLALVQAERGKLQSAIANTRRAIARTGDEPEAIKLLARVLLDAGRLREAGEQLTALGLKGSADAEIAMLNVRWHLARREAERATKWGEMLCAIDPSPVARLRLAQALEVARHDSPAAAMYEQVVSAGFYPAAHLGLARLATRRKDKSVARKQLHAALNFEKTVGARGVGPGPLFHAIINQLMLLEDRQEQCRAWIATPPGDYAVKALQGHAVLVFATDLRDAGRRFEEVAGAMQPVPPPLPLGDLHWKLAAQDRQPDRPVYPGVQGLA